MRYLWKTLVYPKGTLNRRVLEYKCVSFSESSRTTMYCWIICKHLHHICIWIEDLYIMIKWYQMYIWINCWMINWRVYFTQKNGYLTIYMIIIENLTNLVNLIFCMRKVLIMYNVNKLLYIFFNLFILH